MSRLRLGAVLLGFGLLSLPLLADEDLPLKNWPAPPYWSPASAPVASSEALVGEKAVRTGPESATASGPTPLPFVAITPCRLIDTRAGSGFPSGYGPPSMPGGHARRSFTITGQCGIPADAQAVSFNFTVWAPYTEGDIRVLPAGGATPEVSTLNWGANILALANAAIVPLGTGGAITVQVDGDGTINLIVDVNGYFSPLGVVNSVNTLSGAVTLAEGANVTITPSGQTLTIASANAGGTVSSVGSGAGLTGGPITTAGTISVQALGITTSMLADLAVTSAKLAPGAVGLSQIDSSQVQARVTSTCPSGSTVQAINANGSVVCAVPPVQTGFVLTAVDSAGNVGQCTSITIGSDGLGLISYYDVGNFDLKVAHCSNAACTSASTVTLDSAGIVGQETSITVGSDGLGLISYYDSTNGDLRVAHCSNVNCSTATRSTLDSTGNVGFYTSITTGLDGFGLISYFDVTNGDLKVAHCSNVNCTSATLSTLDSAGEVGSYTGITIGADGLGLISYLDTTNMNLKVAHCSNAACTSATLSTLDSAGSVGWYTSITVGSDGLGLISYHDYSKGDLKVAHCSDANCSTATLSTLDSTGNVGFYTSITIGSDGLGVISYNDVANVDLKVAHCSDVNCSTATVSTLDSTGVVGYCTAITIGTDGLGLISYYDQSNGDLKVAHCSNALCTPWVRRK